MTAYLDICEGLVCEIEQICLCRIPPADHHNSSIDLKMHIYSKKTCKLAKVQYLVEMANMPTIEGLTNTNTDGAGAPDTRLQLK